MRMGVDSVVVIVTKITHVCGLEKKLNLIPQARMGAKFKRKELIQTSPAPGEDSISIFSFDSFDFTADAVSRLRGKFEGISRVYKCDGRYFLLLQNETQDDRNTHELEAVLHEYGQKHVSNMISRQYLTERGETLINDNAVEKLAAYNLL
jgi:adapter protein MecA 1/2